MDCPISTTSFHPQRDKFCTTAPGLSIRKHAIARRTRYEECFFHRARCVAFGRSPDQTHMSLPGARAKSSDPTCWHIPGSSPKTPYGSSVCTCARNTSAVAGSIFFPAFFLRSCHSSILNPSILPNSDEPHIGLHFRWTALNLRIKGLGELQC